jgi:hypothetical protein
MHPFRSHEDFGWWLGSGDSTARSVAEAMTRQKKAFPELFPAVPAISYSDDRSGSKPVEGVSYQNPYEVDFIICLHCKNITMRIEYAARQVETEQEAAKLVEQEGYTGWTEVLTQGNMTRRFRRLAMLGRADLDLLQAKVAEGREFARKESNQEAGRKRFEATFDPILTDYVRKLHEYEQSVQIENVLRQRFEDNWERLHPDCRDFLMTAEVLKEELHSYSETNPAVDFTLAVHAYSRALEKELLEKLFVSFRQSEFAKQLPSSTGNSSHDRSIRILTSFVDGKSHLTLGGMGFCLHNVGCALRDKPSNGYARFLKATLVDLNSFCDDVQFQRRVIKYTDEFRNRAAHVSRLTYEECLTARAYLMEEPIKLLIRLQEMMRP